MGSRYHLAAILIAVFLTVPAYAQDKKGAGLALGVGVSQIRDKDSSGTFNGNAVGFSLEGEYRFTPNFALGLSVINLGKADDTVNGVRTTIDVHAIGVFVRGIKPVSDKTDIYVRLGGVSYHADVSPGVNFNLFGEDAVEIGAGVDIGSGDHFSYRIEGRYLDGPRDESGALLTVGFSYRF